MCLVGGGECASGGAPLAGPSYGADRVVSLLDGAVTPHSGVSFSNIARNQGRWYPLARKFRRGEDHPPELPMILLAPGSPRFAPAWMWVA